MRTLVGCLLLLASLAGSQSIAAAERGNAEEARALCARAIEAYKAEGEAVFQRITAPSKDFVDRDLYVFVIGPDHKLVANGSTSRYLGTYFPSLKDAAGNTYGQDMIDAANEGGEWVEYEFPDPITGEILPKSTWVTLHDGHIFGCGYYKA